LRWVKARAVCTFTTDAGGGGIGVSASRIVRRTQLNAKGGRPWLGVRGHARRRRHRRGNKCCRGENCRRHFVSAGKSFFPARREVFSPALNPFDKGELFKQPLSLAPPRILGWDVNFNDKSLPHTRSRLAHVKRLRGGELASAARKKSPSDSLSRGRRPHCTK